MGPDLRFFATAAKGIEPLLADELRAVGAADVEEERAGVGFAGPLLLAYRVCLWSRLAQRVLLPLSTFQADDEHQLYFGVAAIDWEEHLDPTRTLAVDFVSVQSAVTHTRFGAQKSKDAIVDQFRKRQKDRPSVDVKQPDLRINIFAHRREMTVSLDLSGDSLHRRGYRTPGEQVQAPLKETLAAAILVKAGWPAIAAAGGSVVDPLCGSATLPIEAALIACDIAPGLTRERFGFLGWKQHDADGWQALVSEARERREAGIAAWLAGGAAIEGYDRDKRSITLARRNVAKAGLEAAVTVGRRELSELAPPQPPAGPGEGAPVGDAATATATATATGLVVTNPPYGERMGAHDRAALATLYELLGERLKDGFRGWQAAILVGDLRLGHNLGLRARRTNRFFNGALECTLLRIEIEPRWMTNVEHLEDGGGDRSGAVTSDTSGAVGGASGGAAGGESSASPPAAPPLALTPAGEQFANRLRKNAGHFGRVMRRAGVTCYRVYDADLPDFAVAIDRYERWAHVQEYAAPPEIEPARAAARLAEAMRIVPEVLGIPADDVFLKVRKRQRGKAQYDRQATRGVFHEVREADCVFLVNFSDYLDTGLFLQAREVRRLLRQAARGARFLNLFGYTGAATVAAAKGGALNTTTVDLSPHYLEWAQRNFALNKLDPKLNATIAADCLAWVAEATGQYDLIYLDPPTFSNSKKMGRATFDVQRDHADLIRLVCRRLLAAGGTLVFAGNSRKFRMDTAALEGFDLEDLSRATLPRDFERSARTHHVWRITGSD